MNADDEQALSALLKTELRRYTAPPELRQRIQADLAASQPPVVPATSATRPALRWHHQLKRRWAQWAGGWPVLTGGFAAGALSMFMGLHLLWGSAGLIPGGAAGPQEDIVSSHIRALQVNHLADVVSTDQHTVKPWFIGKLDYAPVVQDFAPAGFTLTGGRMDYVNHRPVAALVYQHRQHIINAYSWPLNPGEASSDSPPQASQHRGYQMLSWTSSAMRYWLISDTSAADLHALAQLITPR